MHHPTKTQLVLFTAVCALAPSFHAAAPVPLFDDKTLNGWSMSPADSWIVKNGIMANTGNGGGQIWTNNQYSFYRVILSHRHNIAPVNNHYGSAPVFCDTPPPISRALLGIQFGLPNGAHWDYRLGHNNGGGSLFTQKNPGLSYTVGSRVEILVDARTGLARIAVAQPVGSSRWRCLASRMRPQAGKDPLPSTCTTSVCLMNTKTSRSRSIHR